MIFIEKLGDPQVNLLGFMGGGSLMHIGGPPLPEPPSPSIRTLGIPETHTQTYHKKII